MKNSKGFTLIEVLAAIVILGILMGVMIPNIIGIQKKNKINQYLDDAKKLKSVAEYKVRGSDEIEKPANGETIILRLDFLDNSEFDNAPNKKPYAKKNSYVVVKNNNYTYEYIVILLDDENRGIPGKTINEIVTAADKYALVKDNVSVSESGKSITVDGTSYSSNQDIYVGEEE